MKVTARDYAKRTASDRVFVKVVAQAPVLFAIHAPKRLSRRASRVDVEAVVDAARHAERQWRRRAPHAGDGRAASHDRARRNLPGPDRRCTSA